MLSITLLFKFIKFQSTQFISQWEEPFVLRRQTLAVKHRAQS